MRTVADKSNMTSKVGPPRVLDAAARTRIPLGYRHLGSSTRHFQRAIGNQATRRLLWGPEQPNTSLADAELLRFGFRSSRTCQTPRVLKLQTKLAVDPPGDKYEREAESVAASFEAGNQCLGDLSSHSSDASSGSAPVPPIVESALSTTGVGLDAFTRAKMEARFGHQFSDVRVHADTKAAQAARSVGALAYTVGPHVVFGAGQYSPSTKSGRKLLAHELAHVVQQGRARAAVQRQRVPYGPLSGEPPDWTTRVTAARTSAARAALIRTATGMAVSDATSASVSDRRPTAAHLVEYSAASQRINYDNNLNSKVGSDRRRLDDNAAYTLHHGGQHFVILGPLALHDRGSGGALTAGSHHQLLVYLNHEFDHIRQAIAGSAWQGNESELDAWTSSFVRDFHRTYRLYASGSSCFVRSTQQWTPLLDYYHRDDVSVAARERCVRRLSTFFSSVVSGHAAHLAAFRFWVYRSMGRLIVPNLAERLNMELQLRLSANAPSRSMREFPCGTTRTLTYQPPSLARPDFAPVGLQR